jgi:hypothetical protein
MKGERGGRDIALQDGGNNSGLVKFVSFGVILCLSVSTSVCVIFCHPVLSPTLLHSVQTQSTLTPGLLWSSVWWHIRQLCVSFFSWPDEGQRVRNA